MGSPGPVKLAKATVESYVRNGDLPEIKLSELPEWMNGEPRGCFVSLKIKGELRGCIGTIAPTQGSLVDEIAMNAVSAASRDPRFSTVSEDELSLLEYSVDILTEPEGVSDLSEMDPKKYGVIVSSGNKRGLLLPDLEGVDTVEQQVEYATAKAGISSGSPVEYQRFEVKRYQ